MEFDLDCNPIDQRGRTMYGERPIHGAIYQRRPDVGSVVHNHAHEVIPYSVTKVPMRQVIHTAGGMGHHVPVWTSAMNSAIPTCSSAPSIRGAVSRARLATTRRP
jgi:ribulose-5-phosphate 4-epimerase/fuculose-1-phosphate aldolase